VHSGAERGLPASAEGATKMSAVPGVPLELNDVTNWISAGVLAASGHQAHDYEKLRKEWEAHITTLTVVDVADNPMMIHDAALRTAMNVLYNIYVKQAKSGAVQLNDTMAKAIRAELKTGKGKRGAH
jgi:hypothetical protein